MTLIGCVMHLFNHGDIFYIILRVKQNILFDVHLVYDEVRKPKTGIVL